MVGNLAYSIKDLGYSQILKTNIELSKTITGKSFTIDILSNVTINPIKEILELSIRAKSLNPVIRFGNYDNIIQDTFLIDKTDMVVVFYELINLSENFYLEAELLAEEEVQDIIIKCKSQIDIIFSNLSGKPLVIFNTFSSYPFTGANQSKRNLDLIAHELNQYAFANKPLNFQLIDINRLICTIGLSETIDKKKFQKYKSLYRIDFLKHYVSSIENILLRRTGKLKKALVLDCDNTLWKGVIGEDGPDGIDMSAKSDVGIYYHQVQNIVASLSQKGVLVCLCSKNNLADIETLFNKHSDMVLKNDHVVAMKVNWSTKDENLRALAKDLNIGLDSFVFVDDSEFEVNLIKSILPEIVTILVPKEVSEYPSLIMEAAQRYFNLEPLQEDLKKVKIYKEQAQRADAMNAIGNIDDYLATLETRVVINKNDVAQIPRIAQLTQKTNQFNLTTKRYSETEISSIINDLGSAVFTIHVSDKFGESGITGVIILRESMDDKNIIEIDSCLLSCRILGRKIEVAFLNAIVEYCKDNDYKTISSKYIQTAKNSQVEQFYTEHQFKIEQKTNEGLTYVLDLANYKAEAITFIRLIKEYKT